jgi:hypothetical protein
MKKFIAIMLSIVMVTSINFSVIATNSEGDLIYSFENITIIFDESTSFSESSRTNIANFIVGGKNDIQTYGLVCTLFGHNYVTDYVTTITHNVCESQPKCLREIFEVGECSRCNDTYADLINSLMITCCN